jgi:hypothetical protein
MPSQNDQNKTDGRKATTLNTPNLSGSALPQPVGSIKDSAGNTVEFEVVLDEGAEELPESLLPIDPLEALEHLNRLRDGVWSIEEETQAVPEPVDLNREMMVGFAKRHGITALIGMMSDAMGELGYVCDGDYVHHKSGRRIKP